MNILIIEDETWAAKDLQNLLQRIEPSAKIMDALASVDAAVRWLKANPTPDLILSDIHFQTASASPSSRACS